jgi:hypothetical protein
MQITFQRQESDHWIHNESISRLQTDNSGAQQQESFAGTCN